MPAAIFVSPLEYAARQGRISLDHNFGESARIPSIQLAAEEQVNARERVGTTARLPCQARLYVRREGFAGFLIAVTLKIREELHGLRFET
jgi:hypothetical protein